MKIEINQNYLFIERLDKFNSDSKGKKEFIDMSFNCFLQFYNTKENYEIKLLKEPNKKKGINGAVVIVQDKLDDSSVEYNSEAPKIEEAIFFSKERFLRETQLPLPVSLNAKLNSLTDNSKKEKSSNENSKIFKLGYVYSKIFLKNKNEFFFNIFYHSKKDDNLRIIYLTSLAINYKNSRELFEYFDGQDEDFKNSKKKMYFNFLKNTKLPLPENLQKEEIEIFLNELMVNIPSIKEEPNENSLNTLSRFKWASNDWKFEGFASNKRKQDNLAFTALLDEVNVKKILCFRTFESDHDFQGVPKGIYNPGYSMDMQIKQEPKYEYDYNNNDDKNKNLEMQTNEQKRKGSNDNNNEIKKFKN
ncbi:unnamed protein product [Brachionus calyciflorus]|uniref:Uncharacterized protein n=1 Tax=Brachionus calyciflorus TaxID=104777 RepID=A0A814B0L3_9BILA|nr:unnamed protein product [Brachionus calyciflorus]